VSEEAQRDFARLTPPARDQLTGRVGQQMQAAPVLRSLRESDYVRQPVSVERFIYDNRYLGGSLNGSVFPAIVDDLIELFEGDYLEVCLSGSWGWGKTREIEIGIAYELYLLSCMREPSVAYGLIRGSTLVFLNVSVDVTQAKRVLFGGLYQLLQLSPYFRRICPFDHTIKSELRFRRKNLSCRPVAASEGAILGEDVYSAAIDEANFMEVVEKSRRSVPGDTGIYDQAQAVADKLSARMRTRFDRLGKLPGHLWFASSARFPNDFTERKEAEAKTNRQIFTRHRANWESRPRRFFLPENFKVEVGDITKRTRILKGDETDVTGTVVEVPMNFYPQFLNDPDKSVRDLAGYSVLSITPFIARREMIQRMFELGKEAGLRHPFTKVDPNGLPLDVTLQGISAETERIVPEFLHHVRRQRLDSIGRKLWKDARHTIPEEEEILFPGLYYAHVDLAKGQRDKCGVVVSHVIATRPVERLDKQTAKPIKEHLPVHRVDLVLRIVAPPNGEVDFPSIRAIFHQLRDAGMQFGKITYDQYQCVAGKTLVWSDHGLLPARELQEGMMVASRIGPRKLTKKWSFGKRPVRRIRTTDGMETEATYGHKFEAAVGWRWVKTERGKTKAPIWGWKRVADLRPGDVLRTWREEAKVDVPGLQPLVPFSIRCRKSPARPFTVPVELDAALARWLSVFYGTGNFESEDGVAITCALGHEHGTVRLFRAVFPEAKPSTYYPKDRKAAKVSFFSRDVVRWLKANGFDKTQAIPDKILRSPKEVQAGFVAGLFSSNGAVGKADGACSYSTAIRERAEYVHVFLRSVFGLDSNICFSKCKQGYATANEYQYIVNVRGSRQSFLDKIGFLYTDKRRRLRRFASVPGRRLWTRVESLTESEVSHNSQESIKALKDAGFTSDLFSVDDENATAYEIMKQALYDQRVLCYEYPILKRELAQLERTPKKVDHPIRGSKDLADCLAGALCHAEEGWRNAAGSLGLFQLGEVVSPGQPSPKVQGLVARASEKVVTGQGLTAEEEDAIIFGDLGS
jgi:LAGLIDADG-like domain